MLRRTTLRNLARAPRLARASSSSPSSKICVVPFKVTPNEAREHLYPMGLMTSGRTANMFYAAALRILGSGLEPIGRELGWGGGVQLKSLVPAYWPVWRWDMMAEGPWAPAHGGEESPAWLTVREAYVPGNPYAPLSYVSFAIPPLEDNLREYDPSRDLHQFPDTEIVPIDFTVNPFASLESLKRKLKDARPVGGFRVDPDKWQASLLAAYPVYFPIYIAEYYAKEGEEERTYQLIMDAHADANSCRVSAPPPPEVRATGRAPKNYFVNPAPFMPTMTLILGSAPSTPFQEPPPQVAMKNYTRYYSPKPDEDRISASPTLKVSRDSQIDWNDPRIQAYNSVEREQNGDYIDDAFDVQKNFAAISNMAHASEQLGDGANLKDIDFRLSSWEDGKVTTHRGPMSDMKKALEDSLAHSTAELAKRKPHWLKELEEEKKKAAEAIDPPAPKKEESN